MINNRQVSEMSLDDLRKDILALEGKLDLEKTVPNECISNNLLEDVIKNGKVLDKDIMEKVIEIEHKKDKLGGYDDF
jgi:hypothetical protein